MNTEFKKRIDQLTFLMKQLMNSQYKSRDDLGNISKNGVYVFFENKKAIYVGRSNRMKDRILMHGRPSSDHYSATFAFNLAKKEAEKSQINTSISRDKLEKDQNFKKLFLSAKDRVSRMTIKTIEINDQIMQTLFEIYASVELKTEFNDFATH